MERKIKIVRIINRFNIGGPTFNATFLTRYLSDEYETLLLGGVPDDGEKDSLHILKKYGIEPIIISELSRSISLNKDRKVYSKIKKIIQEYQPDIVHTHASKAGLLGRLAAKSAGVPVIVHTFHGHVFHSYFGKAKTALFKNIERYLAKQSTGIIAISKLQKKELVEDHKIVKESKVKIIPLGFELEQFNQEKEAKREVIRDKYNISEGEIAIAIVGRLAPIKDHSFFLSVIEKLAVKINRKIKVFIVGGGSEFDQIASRVKEINHSNVEIIMTSWVLDIAIFNAGMDIVCLTSKNEGTPVSLIEAQATGIPVVSTNVGGVSDIVVNNEAGYIINHGDIETYVEKLRLLVEDKELRLRFGTFGKEFVVERFGYQKLVSSMDEYYKELLDEK